MPGTGAGPRAGPGPGNDFGAFLSRALHAAADQVEPLADGLTAIRARILAGSGAPRPQAQPISRSQGG